MAAHPNCGNFYHAKMEQFKWTFSYSAIFMVWCAGYLTKPQLIDFLMEAKVTKPKLGSSFKMCLAFLQAIGHASNRSTLSNLSRSKS